VPPRVSGDLLPAISSSIITIESPILISACMAFPSGPGML
jgi:hypothetical protein